MVVWFVVIYAPGRDFFQKRAFILVNFATSNCKESLTRQFLNPKCHLLQRSLFWIVFTELSSFRVSLMWPDFALKCLWPIYLILHIYFILLPHPRIFLLSLISIWRSWNLTWPWPWSCFSWYVCFILLYHIQVYFDYILTQSEQAAIWPYLGWGRMSWIGYTKMGESLQFSFFSSLILVYS